MPCARRVLGLLFFVLWGISAAPTSAQSATADAPTPLPIQEPILSRLPEVTPGSVDHVNDLEARIAELEGRLNLLSQRSAETGSDAQFSEPTGTVVGSELSMSGKWNNQLEFRTPTSDFRSHFGGCVQFDVVAFDNDPAIVVPQSVGGIGAQPNSLNLRRGRFRADGTIWENVDYMAEVEFANFLTSSDASQGQPVAINPAITDFWITWTHIPVFGNIRAGNQKEPMGMEHMMSFRFTDFLERSFLQDVAFGPYTNGFSPGVCAFDWSQDENITWGYGWFGNASDVFGYSVGNDFAFTGRVTWLPYYDESTNGRYLWHVGMSASTRGPDEGQVRLRTRGNVRSGPPGTLNPIYGDTRFMDADSQQFLNFETAIQSGPWTFQGEYTGSWVPGAVQPFAPAPPVARGTPYFQGGYVELMYFLTGEHRNFNKRLGALDRPLVYTPMFIVGTREGRCTGSGAVQVGVRYSAMDLNSNGINGGNLHSMTCGLNWFWNPNTKVQFNYDLTHRSEVQAVPAGLISGFGTRFSIDF